MDEKRPPYGMGWFTDVLSAFDCVKESNMAYEEYATVSSFIPVSMEDLNNADVTDVVTFRHKTFCGISKNYRAAMSRFEEDVISYIDSKLNDPTLSGESILFIREYPYFRIADGKFIIKCRLSAGRIPRSEHVKEMQRQV